jgi:hypothetical protein
MRGGLRPAEEREKEVFVGGALRGFGAVHVGESETAEGGGEGYFWEVGGTRRAVMSCRVTLSGGGGGRGVFFFFLQKGKGLNFAIFDIWLLRVTSRQGFDLQPRRSLS